MRSKLASALDAAVQDMCPAVRAIAWDVGRTVARRVGVEPAAIRRDRRITGAFAGGDGAGGVGALRRGSGCDADGRAEREQRRESLFCDLHHMVLSLKHE